jgi:hypothetical protein
MAKAHEVTHTTKWEPVPRHHGRNTLAEVVPMRPEFSPASWPPANSGPGRALFRIAQVFASLRAQAAPVDPPPYPPSSPAPLRSVSVRPVAPDAA